MEMIRQYSEAVGEDCCEEYAGSSCRGGLPLSTACENEPNNIRNRLYRLITRSEETLERLAEICGEVPTNQKSEEVLPLGTIGEIETVLSILEDRVHEVRHRVMNIQNRI